MFDTEYENDVHDKIQEEQEELAYAPPSTVSPSQSPVQPSEPLFEEKISTPKEEISTPKNDQKAESFVDTGKLQTP